MEFQVEVEPVFYVTGINPDTPFLGRDAEGNSLFIRLTDESTLRPMDFLVVVDMNCDSKRVIEHHSLEPRRCILIRQEPHVVCPANYSAATISLFGKIVDVGRLRPESTLSIPCPQVWPETLPDPRSMQGRNISTPVLMNANKMSFIRGELYSLRREIIHRQAVDLYGPRWDSKGLSRIKTLGGELAICLRSFRAPTTKSLAKWFRRHPRYLGLAADKIDVYSRYKVVLAIENSREYMSEKLLDAIFAGCIPVYVGPPLDNFGIPESLVVQSEPNPGAIASAIDVAKAMDYPLWFDDAVAYLRNAKVADFWSPRRISALVSAHIRYE